MKICIAPAPDAPLAAPRKAKITQPRSGNPSGAVPFDARQEEWFAPAKVAVAGLTADQANWTPGKGQHSVGQLAYHLWYWNARALQRFKGEKLLDYSGNNDETFDKFDPAQWEDLQKKLDQVMTDWETAFETADDQKLAANASLIEHEATHNAYHLGQILYVRKLEGAWDPSKGVK